MISYNVGSSRRSKDERMSEEQDGGRRESALFL
jgi:hypothetical protein